MFSPRVQGGVSKAFSSPKPMFISTGVSLTVSAVTATRIILCAA
jgi:hypothetical protein